MHFVSAKERTSKKVTGLKMVQLNFCDTLTLQVEIKQNQSDQIIIYF